MQRKWTFNIFQPPNQSSQVAFTFARETIQVTHRFQQIGVKKILGSDLAEGSPSLMLFSPLKLHIVVTKN